MWYIDVTVLKEMHKRAMGKGTQRCCCLASCVCVCVCVYGYIMSQSNLRVSIHEHHRQACLYSQQIPSLPLSPS